MPLRQRSVKPTVLVADDDRDIRRFLHHVLNDAGYRVKTAADLYEAMERLRDSDVAAMILDMLFVNSDGYTGLDLLRFARSQPGLKDLPVIVLTGFPLNSTVVAQVSANRAELWHKPVDPIDLVHRVFHLVHRRMPMGT